MNLDPKIVDLLPDKALAELQQKLADEDDVQSITTLPKTGRVVAKLRPGAVEAIGKAVMEGRHVNVAEWVEGNGAAHTEHAPTYPFTPGGNFILDTPIDVAPIWGSGDDVILADGEALMIVGQQGVGKSTLGQQLALGRAGFAEYANLLGHPIRPGAGKVLYLAMDRPKQIARSMIRMVGESWRDELDRALVVWEGPPPADLAKHTELLVDMCRHAGADTVVVDSLKDAAVGLSDDEVGAGYNRARQKALRSGVQVIELHHNRKRSGSDKRAKPTIDDVYGSTWLPSGGGSILLLDGDPGDPVVQLFHLKQPVSEFGPLKLVHDHSSGSTALYEQFDPAAYVSAADDGVTAVDVARRMFDTDKPTPSQKEKARRRLDRLAADGVVAVVDEGDVPSNRPKRWGPR